MIARHPRGSETGVPASVARDGCIVVTQRITPARSRGTDSSGSRDGAGATIEGKQKAFVPPPAGRAGRVPRESFRGKCGVSPAGFASRGGIASPLRGTRRPPLGASGALPPRFARLRGRGLPRFCRLHHVGPLRPDIGTYCAKHRIPRFFASAFPGLLARHKDSPAFRPARVLRNHFPLCKPRAYTPVIATVPISNIRARFCNTSRFRCILSFPPRPFPQSGRAEGIPVGRQSLPQGEPFPAFSLAKTFSSSSGKAAPAEQITKNYCF